MYACLRELNIPFDLIRHEAVVSMRGCIALTQQLHAVNVKNFFLCPRNQSRFYLLITRPDARLRTADISKQAGASRLAFAPEEKLYELLGEHPGMISPMGLIFDKQKQVTLLVDDALYAAERLAFHPCVNTASLALSGDDFFHTFLPALGYTSVPVTIHDFLSEEEMQ